MKFALFVLVISAASLSEIMFPLYRLEELAEEQDGNRMLDLFKI